LKMYPGISPCGKWHPGGSTPSIFWFVSKIFMSRWKILLHDPIFPFNLMIWDPQARPSISASLSFFPRMRRTMRKIVQKNPRHITEIRLQLCVANKSTAHYRPAATAEDSPERRVNVQGNRRSAALLRSVLLTKGLRVCWLRARPPDITQRRNLTHSDHGRTTGLAPTDA